MATPKPAPHNRGLLGAKVDEGIFTAIHDIHKAGRTVPTIAKLLKKSKRTIKIVLEYDTYPEYRKNSKSTSTLPDAEMEKRMVIVQAKVKSLEVKFLLVTAFLTRKYPAEFGYVKELGEPK